MGQQKVAIVIAGGSGMGAAAARQLHQAGFAEGKTCIDCHKGIAHSLPPVNQAIGVQRDSVAPEVMHPAPAR